MFTSGDVAATKTLLENPRTQPQLKTALTSVVNGTLSPNARAQTLGDVLAGLAAAERGTLETAAKGVAVFKAAFTDGIRRLYQIGVLIGFFITALLPEIPLRKGEGLPAFGGGD